MPTDTPADVIAEHKELYAEWEKGLGLDPPASQGAVEPVAYRYYQETPDFAVEVLGAGKWIYVDTETAALCDPTILEPLYAHPAADTANRAAEDTARLDWIEQNINVEISYSGWESPGAWEVHTVNGGRNDREWTLRGIAENLRDAVDQAREASKAEGYS